MADEAKRHVLNWLRDAYAMEEQAESLFQKEIARIDDYPSLRQLLRSELQAARHNAVTLKTVIEAEGESTSVVKEALGKFVAMGQAVSGLFTSDEVVKAALAISTFGQMRVSSFRILAAGLEGVGRADQSQTFEDLADSAQVFLSQINELLPDITDGYLVEERVESLATMTS